MSDKLVFDLSQEIEGSPNVFIRKDWLNILDNQNQNYQSNQSVIDTSQLSNSNKYMSYREAYLSVPLTLSIVGPVSSTSTYNINDNAIGLKNWFGTLIHSFTLDYNGTTIVQQTPFCNIWNNFKLLTTLSWNDVMTQGATIGFYPDTPDAWLMKTASLLANNDLDFSVIPSVLSGYNQYRQQQTPSTVLFGGNTGLANRIKWNNFAPGTTAGVSTYDGIGITASNCSQVWKSYINQEVAGTTTQSGLQQVSVMATIYLKHIHSFFNMVPLIKGAFMKMTMNLNNASGSITLATNDFSSQTSIVPVGGVNPLLIPSKQTGSQWWGTNISATGTINYDVSVGSTPLSTISANVTGSTALSTGKVSKSIYLYVPAYTFNPVFEQAYLSSPIKQIKYTDIYQYQVLAVAKNTQFNQLITNGIANIKSVLIVPFLQTGTVQYQSLIDPAGGGTTAPMVTINNFNVQISGQNAIYNMQRYSFEEFNNQLYGCNAVNGGLTDGLTSSLIDYNSFQHTNCYYYVNVERMLPVEQSVPKSVQIVGNLVSEATVNFLVFVEYGVEVSIDILTGARV